ncbi:MAG: hypothetical protein IKO47_03480 [Ruminococcus sp.]|nr:hypothetical protein [Ruminococcus sp.]
MDAPILISLAVLAVIAGTEIVCLFVWKSPSHKAPVAAIIPVFPDFQELGPALDRLRTLILCGSCPVGHIILLDYGGGEAERELCSEFCRDLGEAVVVAPEDLENFLSEIFAFVPEK